MKDDYVALAMVLFVALVVAGTCVVLGWHNGAMATESQIRADAIEHGVAEWRIDAETGERSFCWKEQE
jgi:hypothetical protein